MYRASFGTGQRWLPINRPAQYIKHAPQCLWPHRHIDGSPCVLYSHAAVQACRTLHSDAANDMCANMFLNLHCQGRLPLTLDLQRV